MQEKKKQEEVPSGSQLQLGLEGGLFAQQPFPYPAIEFLIIAISGCAPKRSNVLPGKR